MTQETPRRRKWLWLGLQILGTTAAFAYILSIVDLEDIGAAAASIPAWSIAAALALTAINLVVGAVRWGVLLRAYGAPNPPSVLRLVRLYYIGHFYNSYLPGGVGGDVVRAVITREAFGESGTTRALTVVLVERIHGLSGLLTVVTLVTAFSPPIDVAGLGIATMLGFAAAIAAVLGIAMARRLSRWLPGKLGELAAGLPELRSRPAFFSAYGLSLITQSLVALTGWSLLVGLSPTVSLADGFIIVPIAAATAFLPFTVAGAGAREATFVALASAVTEASESQAAAASLMMWAAQLAIAAIGGLLQLRSPVGKPQSGDRL